MRAEHARLLERATLPTMRILIVSPLYPPDIAEPAPYVKELARRLSQDHQVSLVVYGDLPEQIPGVHITPISKRLIAPVRGFLFFIALFGALGKNDVCILENGPSAELPALAAFLFRRSHFIFHLGDVRAVERSSRTFFAKFIHGAAHKRAAQVVTSIPLPKPEIHPLKEYPYESFTAYESSWETHLNELSKALRHA